MDLSEFSWVGWPWRGLRPSSPNSRSASESSLRSTWFAPSSQCVGAVRQGKEFVNENMYHLVWAPGFCIFFTVTMFNIVGEGLRDALDPKLRQS